VSICQVQVVEGANMDYSNHETAYQEISSIWTRRGLTVLHLWVAVFAYFVESCQLDRGTTTPSKAQKVDENYGLCVYKKLTETAGGLAYLEWIQLDDMSEWNHSQRFDTSWSTMKSWGEPRKI